MRGMLKTLFLYSLTVTFFVAFGALAVSAQNNKGSIIGTVKDPNDALVPNAKVTIVNNADGASKEVTSDEGGNFTVTNLEPGVYKVTVTASGFKTLALNNVTVETNSRVPLEAKFTEVAGAGDNVVNVTADAGPLTESETSVRGDVITGREVTDLPIPQRNFTLLAGLSPGVTRPNAASVGVLGGGSFANGGPGSSTESTRFRESGGSVISANGARATQNNFSLDGVDNNESQFGQIAVYPNPDAISEFKIETSVPSAESGRVAGAIISTTFKSGGNEFHGTLFETYQGRFLSAAGSQFDENGANRGRNPNYVTHNYGGTVGGPVFLPRFGEGTPFWYDGRNKTFFFVSVAGQRNATPAFGGGEFPFVTVPTLKMRAGDFSELLSPGTRTYNTIAGSVTAANGQIFSPLGTPIAGNIINGTTCPSCGAFSTFGRNLLNAYPLPTEAGLTNNYRRNRAEKSNVDSYDVKIDHRITDNNTFFARYSKSKNSRIRDNNFPAGTSPNGNDLPSGFGAGDEFGNSRGITLSDTHSFSPTIINDMRAGWTNVQIGINNPGINGALGFSPSIASNLGAANINNCGTCEGVLLLGVVEPNFSLEFVGDGGPFYFASHNYNFADTLTMVRGNQIWKFGADLRNRRNSNYDGGRNGGVKGNHQYGTSLGGFASGGYSGVLGPTDSGSAIANLLLGYQPGFLGRGTPGGPYTLQNSELAFFVQNDWKVNSNLTLNLGVRYDLFTAPKERFDRQTNFELGSNTIRVAGESAPLGRDLVNLDKDNIGPRIGFAYSGLMDGKLVIRGGYGLVYTTDVSGVQPLTANPGTGAANFQCLPPTQPAGNVCPVGYPNGRYPYEAGIPFAPGSEQVAARGSSFAAPTGGTIIYNDPNRKDAFVHQYNLTAQWAFRQDWLAEAAYVGSRTKNLLTVTNIGSGRDQGGPGSREVTNIGTVITSRSGGSATYDALQTKLEKRLSKGMSVLAAYTWAHAIDDNPGGFCQGGTGPRACGPDDPLRPQLDKANSDLDVRHRFTFASVYDLPFGKGKKFLSDIPTALDLIIGGWQFNNLVTIQSGQVFTPNWNGGRPDLIGDPTPSAAQRAAGLYANPAAFRAPRTRVFSTDTNCFNGDGSPNGNCPMIGNMGRNILRGNGQEFWDASIFKDFPIRAISEDFKVQLRISAYNVLNNVNRSAPITNISDGNFGRDFSEQRRRQMEFALKIIF